MFGSLRDDARFAFRRLRQQPGFTALAALTLSIGLGANLAIFTLLHAVLMQPLPVARPAELVRLGDDLNCCVNSGLQRNYSLFSTQLYEQLRATLTEIPDLAAFQSSLQTAGIRPAGSATALGMPTQFVSSNYFRMFGVTPAAGRLFEPGDDASGATPVMVMSYRTWTEQYGADPAIIGKTVYMNGVGATLVGVASAGFFGDTLRANPTGVWLPLGQDAALRGAAALRDRPESDWLYVMGRVPADTALSGIEAKASAALRAWLGAQSFLSKDERDRLPTSRVPIVRAPAGVPAMAGNFGQPLTMLLVMSGLVLLLAAANLANVLLARADRAQAAIRAALGASSARLVRQSLLEGVLLALAGCVGGFLIAALATKGIVGLVFPPDATLPLSLMPSPALIAGSIALALLTGVLFAAAPAWAMARTNPIDALRGVAREGADRAFVPRRSLVVVQVALSLILLAGAGVLGKSLNRIEHQPLGFATANRLVARISMPPLASEPARLETIYATMVERLRRVPGVAGVTYSLYSPMEGNNWSSGIAISGRPIDPANRDVASWNRVGPDYFDTLGTRIVRGRGITAKDTPTSARVAVVNEAFVRAFLPDRDPIGARVGVGDASHGSDREIVGVVEDVKYSGAARTVRPMLFMPMMQLVEYTGGDAQVQARSTLAGAVEIVTAPGAGNLESAVRKAMAEAHQDLTVTRFVPLEIQVTGNYRTNRLLATLTAAYGGLALGLATLGLYGVTSYSVARRRHEIGIRMALGADRARVMRGVVVTAVLQVVVGLAIGVPAALLAAGALSSQLFNVDARDPVVLGLSALALLAIAGLAAALPARRAASVSPTEALKTAG
jgi:predicted permease